MLAYRFTADICALLPVCPDDVDADDADDENDDEDDDENDDEDALVCLLVRLVLTNAPATSRQQSDENRVC